MDIPLDPLSKHLIARRIASGQFADVESVIGDALRRTEPEQEENPLASFLQARLNEVAQGGVLPQSYDAVFDDVLKDR